MTYAHVATAILLAAGFLAVLAVGFFTGFANTWPIVVYVLTGASLFVLLERRQGS